MEKYIGVHGGDKVNYIGSGKALKRAIKKYGREAFYRETLFEFNSSEEAYSKEAEIVTLDFCNREDTYNCVCGGRGGQTPSDELRKRLALASTGRRHSEATKEKMRASKTITREETRRKLRVAKANISEATRQRISQSRLGKSLPKDVRDKISSAMREHHPRAKTILFEGKSYPSIRAAARELGVCHSHISRRLNN